MEKNWMFQVQRKINRQYLAAIQMPLSLQLIEK